MSVRLFHRGGRLVMRSSRASRQVSTWRALHVRPVAWEDVFRPALALLGFTVENADGALRFGTGSTRSGQAPRRQPEHRQHPLDERRVLDDNPRTVARVLCQES